MARFTSDFISEIKYRNNIVDVISEYTPLKRAGSNHTACCPFHSEKTPSFTVFSKSDSFYCFGCGAGGDVITFVMKIENLDYVSAIEVLAKRAGLDMPAAEGLEEDRRRLTLRKRILEMNREAARFYHECLTSGKYPAAAEYVEKRKLPRVAVKRYGIGYAPGNRALYIHLKNLGYREEEMKAAFLCGINAGGTPYDYYFARIIFPIIDVAGNVIAFGGRAMGDAKPKYLNTNDTEAFKKSKNLFSLNFAKNAKDDFFILCEGYTDVIALNCAGFSSAVASLGTSLTEEQAYLMKKYKSKVIICYDGDAAGQKASARAVGILSSAGLDVRVMRLPEGVDPDEFILRFGPERFRGLLSSAIGRFDYESGEVYKKYHIENVEEKIKAADEIAVILARISSDVERDLYTKRTADKLEIPYDSYKNDVLKKRRGLIREASRAEKDTMMRQTAGYADRINPDAVRHKKAANAEEAILGILQIFPEYLKEETDGAPLTGDDFMTEFHRRVYEAIAAAYTESGKFDLALLGETFSADEIGRITKMHVARAQLADNSPEVYRENVRTLRREAQRTRLHTSEDTVGSILDIINAKKDKK